MGTPRLYISVALWTALVFLSYTYLADGIAFNGTFLLLMVVGVALVADLFQRDSARPASAHSSSDNLYDHL